MKSERLKCPKCGSTKIEITKISEINTKCLFSFTYVCKDCSHAGKISIKSQNPDEVVIKYT